MIMDCIEFYQIQGFPIPPFHGIINSLRSGGVKNCVLDQSSPMNAHRPLGHPRHACPLPNNGCIFAVFINSMSEIRFETTRLSFFWRVTPKPETCSLVRLNFPRSPIHWNRQYRQICVFNRQCGTRDGMPAIRENLATH